MDELKSCPFCGGEAYVYKNYNARLHRYFIYVKCDICGGQGGITSTEVDPDDYDWKISAVDKAINKWNKRVEEEVR